ncbi:MAG TPA: MobA/MobL family protein [Steroidobacteraceae bacterium]|nr:MobA/MobL family protein [Steroidobacteraceae bacterium]
MALYFLNIKAFGRSNGSSAPSAAAYRAGERIRDERTGRTYDHSDRRDVLHKEILVPTPLANVDMSWAKERSNLWNSAEAAETRKNSRVAREYLVALPSEIDLGGRVQLARGFAQELADRYRFAVDVTVHAPRDFPGSDPRNFHAHLLATTREVGSGGLGAKTQFELNESTRRALGLGPSIEELLHVRERWATVTNEALREANVAARVDHRTLRAQGIEREPRMWIPRVPYEVERRGYHSPVAERIRADYAARAHPGRERESEQPAKSNSIPPPSLEEARRQAVENWLRYRQEMEMAEKSQSHELATGADAGKASHGLDDDFSL